jgi:hypothetical protein
MRRIVLVLAAAAMLAAMMLGASGALAQPVNTQPSKDLPSTFYHYAPEAAHQAILDSKPPKINPRGNPPKLFITPDVYTSGTQAQQKLATATTPDGYFVIPANRVKDPQGPHTVDPTCVPGYSAPPCDSDHTYLPGGGTEYTTTSSINAKGLIWVSF